MTDTELKKLRRRDLLELLVIQERENEGLREQNAQLQKRLEDRTLLLAQAGSIAEESLQVSGVFQAAQEAADRYLENVRLLAQRQEESCCRMEAETRKKCQELLRASEEAADRYWEDARRRETAARASGGETEMPEMGDGEALKA